jgi:histidyl-tRNA synthetase
MTTAPLLVDRLSAEDREHFDAVLALLDAADVPYEIDPTLVRGLDYYTRTVFEFASDALGAQSGVGGGGRYDGLIELIGGPPTPGVGWAAGVERILLAAGGVPAAEAAVDVFVAYEPARRADAFAVVTRTRRAGRAAQMELAGRSLKGQLKQASRTGARFVAVLREDGTVLQDTETSAEVPMESHPPGPDGVVAAVLRNLGAGL